MDSSLDREFKSYYILHVTASNIGQNSMEGECEVNITVTDVIDEKPFFDSDVLTYHISENASIGMNVTQLKAQDKDIGDSHTYSLVESDSSGYFHIDRDTGVITTAKDLDRENMTEHVIYVQATDSVNLTSDKVKIVIKVDDVNDRAPLFTKLFYIQDYREESPKDTSILTVAAKDADIGINAEIRFSIVGNATNYVSIDPVTGLISQADTELDREISPYFNFTVRATDRGSPPLSSDVEVSLSLVDVNDNSPVFNKTVYQAYVKENQPVGTPLLVVTATDKDVGTNARLSYGLHGGNFRFNIDQDTVRYNSFKIIVFNFPYIERFLVGFYEVQETTKATTRRQQFSSSYKLNFAINLKYRSIQLICRYNFSYARCGKTPFSLKQKHIKNSPSWHLFRILLSCRGRLIGVPRFVTQVHGHCSSFYSLFH